MPALSSSRRRSRSSAGAFSPGARAGWPRTRRSRSRRRLTTSCSRVPKWCCTRPRLTPGGLGDVSAMLTAEKSPSANRRRAASRMAASLLSVSRVFGLMSPSFHGLQCIGRHEVDEFCRPTSSNTTVQLIASPRGGARGTGVAHVKTVAAVRIRAGVPDVPHPVWRALALAGAGLRDAPFLRAHGARAGHRASGFRRRHPVAARPLLPAEVPQKPVDGTEPVRLRARRQLEQRHGGRRAPPRETACRMYSSTLGMPD